MTKYLKILFFALIVYPITRLLIGLNVHNQDRLPYTRPLILASNHNSHLDAVTLMSLYPFTMLPHIRPAAAADYFLGNAAMAWFTLNVIGIIPVDRLHEDPDVDPLQTSYEALEQNEILLFFPEGSRGEPEQFSEFKIGLARLAERCPQAPVVPIFMRNFGKVWPKGASVVIPFFCDIYIGQPMQWSGDPDDFMQKYQDQMESLVAQSGRSYEKYR